MHESLGPFFKLFLNCDPSLQPTESGFENCFQLKIIPEVEGGLSSFWFEVDDNQVNMFPSYSNPEDIDWDLVPEHEQVYVVTDKTPEQVYEIVKQVKELVRG